MTFISRSASRLRESSGWKAYFFAAGLGACFTLAFPPFWFLPGAAIGFSGLIWLLEGAKTAKRAAWLGWWFGFGHFVTGVYWVTIALGVDASFFWLMPFTISLLPAYMALFPMMAALVFHYIPFGGFRRLMVFSVIWVLTEFARAHFIYGFPWNLAGYIWTVTDASLQPASVFGIYGLSLWTVLLASCFSLMTEPNRKSIWAMVAVSLVLCGWGQWRLVQNPLVDTAGLPVVRIVQGNIEQSLKWDPQQQMKHLQTYMDLSVGAENSPTKPDYIVWPETAMPYPFVEGTYWARVLGEGAPKAGALLTGVVRVEGDEKEWQLWNSIQAVDSRGHIAAVYDKSKLVPFGEFLPARALFSKLGLEKITPGTKDFSLGKGAHTITLPGKLKILQPLICYETIFPDYRPGSGRADWILNITNDAWFGTSTGPYQHFHMARTRAVEQGIPLVRAANTGVSGAFDGFGRILGTIPLNRQGVLDIAVPSPVVVPTWYSLHGNLTIMVLCLLLLLPGLRRRH